MWARRTSDGGHTLHFPHSPSDGAAWRAVDDVPATPERWVRPRDDRPFGRRADGTDTGHPTVPPHTRRRAGVLRPTRGTAIHSSGLFSTSGAPTPTALGILVAAITLAALGGVPVVVAALGGVFAMVATGCLSSADACDAVGWNVVFLRAGVLPLGTALQGTGGDESLTAALSGDASGLPVVVVLALFHLTAYPGRSAAPGAPDCRRHARDRRPVRGLRANARTAGSVGVRPTRLSTGPKI